MANTRSNERVEVNFDGLTDSVTNLVGALILLVVLLVGVTTKAVRKTPATPTFDESQAGQLPVVDLLERVVVLQAQLDSAHQQVNVVAQQVAAFRQQVAAPRETPTESESSE